MANYRKKSSHNYGKRKQKSFAWIWLLTGMILGIVSVVYTFPLFQNGFSVDSLKRFNVARNASSAAQDAGVSLEQKVIIKKKKPETQQYEFYTMLPDMEVALPKEKSASVNPPIVQTKPEPVPVIVQATKQANLRVTPSPRVTPPAKEVSKHLLKNDNYPKVTQSKAMIQDITLKNDKTKAAQYLIQAGMYRSAKEADGLKARLALLGFNTRLQKIDSENGLWFRIIIGPFSNESLAMAQQKKLAMQNIKGILVKQRKLK